MTDRRSALIESAARAAADANGDVWENIPLGKAEWVQARGFFGGAYRELSQPSKSDYLDMAEAAINAACPGLLDGTTWVANAQFTDAFPEMRAHLNVTTASPDDQVSPPKT